MSTIEAAWAQCSKSFFSFHSNRSRSDSRKLPTRLQRAITWDGANKRMYIDGVRVATMPQAQPIFYDGHPTMIGCDDNVGIGEAFAGTLDDFVVYDRALTDAEVALLSTL